MGLENCKENFKAQRSPVHYTGAHTSKVQRLVSEGFRENALAVLGRTNSTKTVAGG